VIVYPLQHATRFYAMKHYLPQIMWHSQNGILAAHFQNQSQCLYKVITGGLETDASSKCVLRVRLLLSRFVMITISTQMWELRFVGPNEEMHIDFIANLQRHDHTVNVVRFSPNGVLLCSTFIFLAFLGKYIASGDMAANVFIWEQQENVVAPDIFNEDDEDMPPNKETWKVITQLRCVERSYCFSLMRTILSTVVKWPISPIWLGRIITNYYVQYQLTKVRLSTI
jgi:hypothetical protein